MSSPLALRHRPSGPPTATVRGRRDGIGRSSSSYAERVSDDLRRHDSALLTHRRRVAGLSLTAIGALWIVGAYQNGLLRSVPEPPLPGLHANAVDASGEAYRLLGTPDSGLGIGSYALTLALAGMGSADRARHSPLLPLLLAGKVGLDALSGSYLFAEQISKHRRLCSWWTLAAASSIAAVPQVLPEAAAAWRTLRSWRAARTT